jgi:hypothetical protein
LLFLFVSLGSGCGGSGSTAGPGGADAKSPPPRAGEDTMKYAMEKLMQKAKGKSLPGIPKASAKR